MAIFKNRAFGAVILKSKNSNFNADFTTHPRTLPDGTVYATDKALKYTIKSYFKNNFKEEIIFYTKRFNDEVKPLTLEKTYEQLFPGNKKDDRMRVASNLFKCLDIKLFGATFAGKGINISIHGPLQINHAVNKYTENNIYTEDILSPFPSKEGDDASTIGNQTNLEEGHYVYHFSLNPPNIEDMLKLTNEKTGEQNALFDDDIVKLKEAFRKSVSTLDSSRKIGTDNEAFIWIQLKEDSRAVLPNLTDFVNILPDEEKDIRIINIEKVFSLVENQLNEIEGVEIYFNPISAKLEGCKQLDTTQNNLIKYLDIFSGIEIKI